MLNRFAADNSGATAIEYALVGSLIFLVVIVGVRFMVGAMEGNYSEISTQIGSATK